LSFIDYGFAHLSPNLELFRRLYLEYPGLIPGAISNTVRRNSGSLKTRSKMNFAASGKLGEGGELNPSISWSYRAHSDAIRNPGRYARRESRNGHSAPRRIVFESR
jgi:hypothetical protein